MFTSFFSSVFIRSLTLTIAFVLCGTTALVAQKVSKKNSKKAVLPTVVAEPTTEATLSHADSLALSAKPYKDNLATLPAEDHLKRAEMLFTLLRFEQYKTLVKNFDTTVIAMRVPQLEALWERTRNIVGTFRAIKDVLSERLAIGEVVTIEAQFTNLDLNFTFTFNEKHRVIGFAYSQAKAKYALPRYAHPEDVEERAVTVQTGEYSLPGLLTLPKSTGDRSIGDKRVPIALLLHDHGTQDRDRSDNGYKPNKDLALGLGKQGIATLRYDKRIRLYPLKEGEIEHYTVNEETVADAVSAIGLIRTLAQTLPIDTTKIFIIAPSFAAMVLPRILRMDSLKHPLAVRAQGAVMLAVNYVKLHELMMPRFEHFFAKNGLTVDEVKQQASIKRRVETVESSKLSLKTSVYDLPYGIPASYWIDLRSYNHVEAIAKLSLPMLFLYGEQDHDIDFTANALAWKTKLADRANVEWKAYPNLFHLFAEGNGSLKDYDRQGNVDAVVIRDIAEWIGNH